MEEGESLVERLSEDVHEAAREAKEDWVRWCAMLSALFAVLGAISGALSGHYANTAMIAQIEASDQWSYYQAKGLKGLVIENERDLLTSFGKQAPTDLDQRIAKYKSEQQTIKAEGDVKVATSRRALEQHEVFARAVTVFQVGIALIAIVILTRRKGFLLGAVGFGVLGLVFFVQGFVV